MSRSIYRCIFSVIGLYFHVFIYFLVYLYAYVSSRMHACLSIHLSELPIFCNFLSAPLTPKYWRVNSLSVSLYLAIHCSINRSNYPSHSALTSSSIDRSTSLPIYQPNSMSARRLSALKLLCLKPSTQSFLFSMHEDHGGWQVHLTWTGRSTR